MEVQVGGQKGGSGWTVSRTAVGGEKGAWEGGIGRYSLAHHVTISALGEKWEGPMLSWATELGFVLFLPSDMLLGL